MLRQLHHLAEAESKLYSHQKMLSEIEAQVDLEQPFVFARINISCDYQGNFFMRTLFNDVCYILVFALMVNWRNPSSPSSF